MTSISLIKSRIGVYKLSRLTTLESHYKKLGIPFSWLWGSKLSKKEISHEIILAKTKLNEIKKGKKGKPDELDPPIRCKNCNKWWKNRNSYNGHLWRCGK